ncbi:xanthine dehydrogenase accessory protein XdhC [Bdellovibrio sp. HCB337]|uniref:xanthine dehydrogenase accessory protein XdhC n=1 Tax=Bdellovibrio sp. HCB337 TaxID=3394358 RepID=UPI0039A6B319
MSWDWIAKLQELKQTAMPAALVTIIKAKGSTPRDIGTKILITDTEFFGTIGGGQLEELVIEKAREILRTHQSPERVPFPLCIKANQCCGGFVEVFVETINTGPQLLIFGAGHVAQAIVKTLEGAPFQIHMIDPRAEWLEKAPSFVTRHVNSGREFIDQHSHWSTEKTYAVVMTYDHDLDQDLVEKLSEKSTKYLGLIGSKTKWQRFQKRLLEKGLASTQLEKVRCPIGLPIGGKSPAEVAISFAAEVVQIQNEYLKISAVSTQSNHMSQEDSWLEDLG